MEDKMSDIINAKWIAASREGTRMPVFGKDLYLEENPVQAKIEICGLGQFALFIGDAEINEGVYEPGWTNYRKRCLYSTYNVTDFLRQGQNRIRVLVGNGMYHEEGGRYVKFTGSFGDPLLIAALRMTFGDGRETVISTDESWSACLGPILFSSIFGGEDYDARDDKWRQSIAQNDWTEAKIYSGSIGKLEESQYPTVRVQSQMEIRAKKILSDGRVFYDFGRNFAGMIRIHVIGSEGQVVKVTPGELLDEKGEIDQQYTGDPHYYLYTLSGKGEEVWAPRFTFYGQRYAIIETDARIKEVYGLERYASCPRTGSFECSNELYNSIHQLIIGAVKSNMQSIFTDCPHREKLGWLEEDHLIGPGILYNFDAGKLYEKILDDMEDAQTKEGLVPSICPEYVVFELGFRDSAEWGSACVLLPWYLYERYGKKELLEKHYAMGQRYTSYLVSKSKDYIVNHGLGDWMDVGHSPAHPANTPIPITATAILYQDLCTLAKIAGVLGKQDDQKAYEDQAKKCREAFNKAFFYPLSQNYANGSQTANAIALFLDLPSDEYRESVLENLKEDIARRDGHFTGGDVGHPYILRALGKCGENEIVAQNFMKTDFPSYGYQVICKATTLCENWAGPNPEPPLFSQNHFMLGAAEEWFYRYLAGIRVDASEEQCIRIQPYFAKEADWVECSTHTPAGICKLSWRRENGEILVTVELEKRASIRLCLNGQDEVVEVEGIVTRKVIE